MRTIALFILQVYTVLRVLNFSAKEKRQYETPIHIQKIGSQCVHVASQQKHQLTIKDRILIKHKAINAILFVFFTIPAMQLLDLV